MPSFREKNNLDGIVRKRRCVYCNRKYQTITGRLICRDCVRKGDPNK